MKLGCFTLPYRKFPFERALEGIARGGFKHVGIWPVHEEKPIFEHKAGEEGKAAEARRACERAGLQVTVLFGQHGPANEAELAEFKIKIGQAAALGASELLCWGPWPWKEFLKQRLPEAEWKSKTDAFFKFLAPAAKHAEQLGVTLSFKPHCGLTASSKELAELVRRAQSSRVRVSYDGGNVSFYEGLDPAQDILPVANLCSSLIIKDHIGGQGVAGPGSFPNVGEGKVEHLSMLRTLQRAGFAGPVSVEKMAGETVEDLDASAGQSYRVLEGYVKELSA